MAVLKCKMCGGELNIEEGSTVCECEYCGSKQTVPTADNEKKMTLFARANRLRFNNEFDKAAGIYENIIADFPEEAEAYWGLVLCKYGIEYVDDPGTAKKVPTCHRSSFDSVFEDNNFDMVMEYADSISKRVYREEAKQIEELRKGIIEVSSKEEPYDIFICYKETDEDGNRTLDSVIAQDIYTALTDKGYKVFFSRITLEDKLGQEYEPYIFAALHSAKVMLAVGTQYEYYDAVWVKNEWSRYLQLISSGEKKVLIPCFKDLDAYDMPKEFARLQAQDMGKIGAMQDLVRGIEKIIGSKDEKNEEVRYVDSGVTALNAQTESLLKRGNMALADGDFTKANEFYERVLDNDAENARAYWGKTLCAYQVKDAKHLAGKLFKDIVYNKKSRVVDFPAVLAIKIVREMDTSGLLKELNDEELENLLRKSHLLPKDDKFLSIKPYYQDSANRYSSENNVIGLINNNDCHAAYRYRDEYVMKEIDIVKNYLQDCIVSEIEEYEEDDFISNFRNYIDETLSLLSEKITEQKTKPENENRTAEEQYKKIDNERAELESKIKQLENEKENLKGLFAGKKRQELDKNIQLLKKKMDGNNLGRASESEQIKESNQEALFTKSIAKLFYTVARKAPTIDDIQKGFGTYPYGRDGIKKPIQWKILEQKGDRVLLITEVGIDGKRFNEFRKDVTWDTSSIRLWLNTIFLSNAFTDKEQDYILTSTVTADKNPRQFTDPGDETQDKVFLLSIQEAEKYYLSKSERVVKATPHAVKNGVKQSVYSYDDGSKWWLRSPGINRKTIAYVNQDGSIAYRGDFADSAIYAVRPALWLEIKE